LKNVTQAAHTLHKEGKGQSVNNYAIVKLCDVIVISLLIDRSGTVFMSPNTVC